MEHFHHEQQQEESGRDGFDEWIAEGKWLAAVAQTPPKPEPAQHGNVVMGPDRMIAARAERAGPGDVHAGRQSIDEHVQEAAHGPAQEKEPGGDHPACRFQGVQIHRLCFSCTRGGEMGVLTTSPSVSQV